MRFINELLLILTPNSAPAPTPAQAHDALIASLAPINDYHFDELSGTTLINYGSAGAALNGTWTPGTGPPVGALDQIGPFGAHQAYLFNGLDSRIDIPNTAAHNALPVFTRYFFIKAASAGEGTFGQIYTWGSSLGFGGMGFSGTLANIDIRVDAATTDARTVTTTGVTAGQDTVLIATYDDGGDRKIRLYKCVAGGVVTEFAYSLQTAAVGTLTTAAGHYWLGNRTGIDTTFDGLFYRHATFPVELTAPQMAAIAAVAFPI